MPVPPAFSDDFSYSLPASGDSSFIDEKKVVDLREVWAAFYRVRYWVAAIVAGCLVASVIATLLMTPRYFATASVQIDQEARKVLGTEQTETSASIQDAERFLRTQADVVRSKSVARAVAQDLRLFGNDSFLELMGEDAAVEAIGQVPLEEVKREKVLEVLAENLDVDLPADSRIVRIGFTTPDPQLSARIANSFAENFIRSNLQRKFESSSYAREFLQGQIEEAQVRLSEAEREALAYARRTRIIDPSAGTEPNNQNSRPRSLTTATLVTLNTEAADATAKRIAAEQRWNRFRATAPLNQPEVLANEAIQGLLTQRAELQAVLEEESQRRREDFPAVRQARARAEEINRQLNAIASAISTSVRTEYEVALANERALGSRVNDLKNETFEEQSQSIQLSILRREAETVRQQFEYLLRRYNELTAESGVQTNNVSMVDRASAPLKPSSPKLILNIVLGLLAGVALSALFAYVWQNLFDTISTPDDLERTTPLPMLGVIQRLEKDFDPASEVLDPKTNTSEAFSSVRSALSLALPHGFPYSLAVVSTHAAEGKSFASYAMAASLGRAGRKVLVLDLDLRRPNQHTYMGGTNDRGMSEVLSGHLVLEQAVRETQLPNVSFVPAGTIPPNPAELLDPQHLKRLVEHAREQYDVVLIDSPPILGLADALMIGSAVEGIVYLVESGRHLPKTVRAALARLEHAKVSVFGVILTKFNARASGYYEYAYDASYAQNPAA
jgi:succinoglycan biosynthesis transport protein ExoP